MNDFNLDKLLEIKKHQQGEFKQSTAEFTADFFKQIQAQKPQKRRLHITILRWAAVAVITLTAVGALYCGLYTPPNIPETPFYKLEEALHLFGGDAAVMFCGNELLTGERSESSTPNNLIALQIPYNEQKIDLFLASADNDTVVLNSPQANGIIVTSRSDSKTLVVDIELTLNNQNIRTAIPVVLKGNYYYSTI